MSVSRCLPTARILTRSGRKSAWPRSSASSCNISQQRPLVERRAQLVTRWRETRSGVVGSFSGFLRLAQGGLGTFVVGHVSPMAASVPDACTARVTEQGEGGADLDPAPVFGP